MSRRRRARRRKAAGLEVYVLGHEDGASRLEAVLLPSQEGFNEKPKAFATMFPVEEPIEPPPRTLAERRRAARRKKRII